MTSKKYMTVSEAAAAKDKAAQFMRNLGKDDDADEFDSMTGRVRRAQGRGDCKSKSREK